MEGAQKSYDHKHSIVYSKISQRQVNSHSDKPSTETLILGLGGGPRGAEARPPIFLSDITGHRLSDPIAGCVD